MVTMMDSSQVQWTQPEGAAELRGYSARKMKRAWRGVGISTVLLAIAWMTFVELRRGAENGRMHAAYIWILWLFIGRFVWSLWKYWCARKEVNAFRVGVERQLKVSGVPKH
jgi:hypothetical protein